MTTAAETAIRDAAAIVRAVAAGHGTPEAISAATGLGVALVKRRLAASGPVAAGTPLQLFRRDLVAGEWRWALTRAGRARLEGAGA